MLWGALRLPIRIAHYKCMFIAPLCVLCLCKNQRITDTAACQMLGTGDGTVKIAGNIIIEQGLLVPSLRRVVVAST